MRYNVLYIGCQVSVREKRIWPIDGRDLFTEKGGAISNRTFPQWCIDGQAPTKLDGSSYRGCLGSEDVWGAPTKEDVWGGKRLPNLTVRRERMCGERERTCVW